ncbi:hypothetical protein [Halomonas sp. 25-S5]|uniref:phage portal protein family protein n=1 Tax=Halomonas sp. 25-S5 TaxID=2994065 RepID=UPI002468A8E3|nr:hypothetical protein [Halomonas sp. 25-S5]
MVSYTNQKSSPIHLENTVLNLSREELNINKAFFTYKEMSLDPIISASMNFLKGLLNRDFKISYHPESTEKEKAVIDALNESLNSLKPYSKRKLLNNVLSMLEYGASLNELTMHRVDNRYVFKNISPIHLTTVNKFRMKRGELLGVTLNKPDNDSLINDVAATQTNIDGSKLLMFTLQGDQDSPLGHSLLKGVWSSWKQKVVVSEYQLVGISKAYGNILSVSVPSSYIESYLNDPSSSEAIYMDHLVQQTELLHSGKSAYVMLPSDIYDGGTRQFEVKPVSETINSDYNANTTINRLNDEMLLALQTSLLSLGNSGSGSFALSESKTNLLSMFCRAIEETISDEFKKAIAVAFDLNGLEDKRIPGLEFEEIEPVDWETVSKYWQRLCQAGAVTPDETLEGHLREIGKAPQADYSKKLDTTPKADATDRLDDRKEL